MEPTQLVTRWSVERVQPATVRQAVVTQEAAVLEVQREAVPIPEGVRQGARIQAARIQGARIAAQIRVMEQRVDLRVTLNQ